MEINRIELSDSDCDLHSDGLPRLIMVTVHLVGGKAKRFPWQADKSITDLFAALNMASLRIPSGPVYVDPPDPPPDPPPDAPLPGSGTAEFNIGPYPGTSDPNRIDRGDTVRCVKVNTANLGPASAGTVFLEVGHEYIVQDVIATNGVPEAYEVANVGDGVQIRTLATPDEVVLVKKLAAGARATAAFEQVVNCPACKEPVALHKKGEKYIGTCDCGKVLDE